MLSTGIVIYANNAATSWPKAPGVINSVTETLDRPPWQLGDQLERTQRAVAELLGLSQPEGVVLTSGATAALSILIDALELSPGGSVITSGLEHHAVVRPLESLRRHRGIEVLRAPYRVGQPIDLDFVETSLRRGDVRAIVCTAASNVTGEVLPIVELGDLARRYGAKFVVDAAQSAGVHAIDFVSAGVDAVAIAGHKGPQGPQGVGALWVRPGLCELGYCELGGVNAAGIAGLASGIAWLRSGDEARRGQHAQKLRAQLFAGLQTRERCHVWGSPEVASTGALSLTIRDLELEAAGPAFARQGVVIRAGHHCAPEAIDSIGAGEQGGTIRICFGPFNAATDVEGVLQAVDAILEDRQP